MLPQGAQVAVSAHGQGTSPSPGHALAHPPPPPPPQSLEHLASLPPPPRYPGAQNQANNQMNSASPNGAPGSSPDINSTTGSAEQASSASGRVIRRARRNNASPFSSPASATPNNKTSQAFDMEMARSTFSQMQQLPVQPFENPSAPSARSVVAPRHWPLSPHPSLYTAEYRDSSMDVDFNGAHAHGQVMLMPAHVCVCVCVCVCARACGSYPLSPVWDCPDALVL